MRRTRWAGSALFCVGLLAHEAAAQDRPATDASTQFRRGVELYSEANYAGALVEFKRAYAIAPSATALYNIGETQFQLQDYAGALKTFRQFLGEYGSDASHHAEVESNIQLLRTRVGVLRVTTVPAGADIAVDDEAVGKTPLGEPVLVSVGRRKVVASMAGRPPLVRYVDVAAEDDLPVTIQLPDIASDTPTVAPPSSAMVPTHTVSSLPTARAIGWTLTGVFAAGAGVLGGLAIHESQSLRDARNTFGASPATLRHEANLTTTYSAVADSLAIAAVVAGGLSLYWTLSKKEPEHAAHVTLGPASVEFATTF